MSESGTCSNQTTRLGAVRSVARANPEPQNGTIRYGRHSTRQRRAGSARVLAGSRGLVAAAHELKDKGTFSYVDTALPSAELAGFMRG